MGFLLCYRKSDSLLRQQVNILGTLKPERQKCIVGVETKYPLLDYYEKQWYHMKIKHMEKFKRYFDGLFNSFFIKKMS